MAIRFIYFDCMETLVHLDIDSQDVYGQWAYECAEGLGVCADRARFLDGWRLHRSSFQERHGEHREGTILGRLRDLIRDEADRRRLAWDEARLAREAEAVHRAYWERYRSSTFVLPEVPEALERIQRGREMPLGVVSNFMVEGGIPSLLAQHGLDRFFQVVVVSCDHGWRKPAPSIYEAAIRAAGAVPEEILFVGDDLVADYHGPRGMGIPALLYDPKGLRPEVEHRIRSFQEIEPWL